MLDIKPAKALRTETALFLLLITVVATLIVELGTRLLNTGTWRTSWAITLITTLVILTLLLGRLLFCFLFVFEFHNCTCFFEWSLTARGLC